MHEWGFWRWSVFLWTASANQAYLLRSSRMGSSLVTSSNLRFLPNSLWWNRVFPHLGKFCSKAYWLLQSFTAQFLVQGQGSLLFPGLVNFGRALDYDMCLNLPATFSQSGNGNVAEPCMVIVNCPIKGKDLICPGEEFRYPCAGPGCSGLPLPWATILAVLDGPSWWPRGRRSSRCLAFWHSPQLPSQAATWQIQPEEFRDINFFIGHECIILNLLYMQTY